MEVLTPITWSKAAKQKLRPAGAVNTLEREVLTGNSQLWSVAGNRLLVVTRIEVKQGVKELVIVAAAGRGLARTTSAIYDLAASSGAKTIRFHTFHPERLANAMQYWPIYLTHINRGIFRNEYIYKLEVR